jgi:hypothetical protein
MEVLGNADVRFRLEVHLDWEILVREAKTMSGIRHNYFISNRHNSAST